VSSVKGVSVSISVLVPVLGRPANAAPLVESLDASSEAQHELIFICTPGDEEQIAACQETWANILVVTWQPERDYGRKMNAGYRHARHDWILLGADDVSFDPGWDTELLRVAEESGKRVIGSNDMANRLVMRGAFSTHPLVARSYVEEHGGGLEGPGLIVSDAYEHNFPDRELACLAMKRGEWAFAKNAVVRHNHPAFGGGKQDATYNRGRDTFLDDQTLFWERSAQWDHVGLIPQEMSLIKRSQRRLARQSTARARRERG
jgi:glycosyltransferase involved in cell wall biosynthesis